MRTLTLITLASLTALSLSACQGKTSAVASRDPQGFAGGSDRGGVSSDPRDRPVPQVAGKPMWAANRRHTAEENAAYQFQRNGADIGAKTENDYVLRAHAFVDHPPKGAESLDRPNGDKLIYDPKQNLFAVVSRDGAPRTLFKPRGGASYWAQQKTQDASGGGAGGGYSGGYGRGAGGRGSGQG